MGSTSQYTTPVIVDLDEFKIEPLEPLPLRAAGIGGYDEEWLQQLLFRLPTLLTQPLYFLNAVHSPP
jgi:hypothetical protein